MDVILHEVAFLARAPDILRIAEEIRVRSGLEVSITESTAAERGGLYDWHAQFAFACAPEDRIAVYALRPGALADRYKIAFADERTSPAQCAETSAAPANAAPDGQQTVYLKGLWRNELTLFFATQLALERLGGASMFPLTERQRIEYDRPFTAAEHDERRRKHRFLWKLDGVLGIILLPVIIPWTLLKWMVIAIIHGAGKLGRTTKAALGSRSTPSEPRV